MPRRSIWKGSFVDAFLLRKFSFSFFLQLRMSLRHPAPFFFTFFFAPISKGRGWGLGGSPSKMPGKLGRPLPSFLEEHEVTSSSIRKRKARKSKFPPRKRNSGKWWGGGFLVVVIANSFPFWRIRSRFLRLRSLKLRPPYSTSIKEAKPVPLFIISW